MQLNAVRRDARLTVFKVKEGNTLDLDRQVRCLEESLRRQPRIELLSRCRNGRVERASSAQNTLEKTEPKSQRANSAKCKS